MFGWGWEWEQGFRECVTEVFNPILEFFWLLEPHPALGTLFMESPIVVVANKAAKKHHLFFIFKF